MSLKIKQQSQTLNEMNSFLTKMKSDLAVAVEGKEVAEGRLFSTEKVDPISQPARSSDTNLS